MHDYLLDSYMADNKRSDNKDARMDIRHAVHHFALAAVAADEAYELLGSAGFDLAEWD